MVKAFPIIPVKNWASFDKLDQYNSANIRKMAIITRPESMESNSANITDVVLGQHLPLTTYVIGTLRIRAVMPFRRL